MLRGVAFLLIVTGWAVLISGPEPSPPAEEPIQTVSWDWTTPAVTPVKDRKVYVIETLPSSWPVAEAVNWIDRYTGSDWMMAKTCPRKAYRCITVRPGNLPAPRLADTRNYIGSRVTIIVDLPYAEARVKNSAKKKWVLAHEFGHAAGLREHMMGHGNLMYRSIGPFGYALIASQRSQMARR